MRSIYLNEFYRNAAVMKSFVVLVVVLFQSCQADLTVKIKDGKVAGTTINTPSGQTFYAWRGIPFAKPPVGKLRYLPPQKPKPWTGVLDASRDSPACIFFGELWIDPVLPSGNSEDCLYINVYSPVPAGSHSRHDPVLPVMFWIYGGGFFTGSGAFVYTDPTPFLEENVIVVTFNHRLSTLGFLTTEDEVLLGNAGLKDQLLALQWTKENIACFGGNPSDITIFGESAGAMSAGYLMISPKSRNLFKGAILQSASPLLSGYETYRRDFAYGLAAQVDSSITKANTSAEILHVLQNADVELIKNLSLGEKIGPTFEIESDHSFLTGPIYESIESGNIARVPMIIGFNKEETIVYVNGIDHASSEARKLDLDPELLVPTMPFKENTTAVRKAIGEKIRQQYVGKNGSFEENLLAFLEWLSDHVFLREAHKHAILQSKYTPVYMYQFSYYGTLSKNNTDIPGVSKVGHTDEVGYLFNVSRRELKTDKDFLTRKRLVKLWTNFAKTSNPTPKNHACELLQNVKWDPITPNHVQYLDIDNSLQMIPSRKVKETIFWDNLWETYANRPYNTF